MLMEMNKILSQKRVKQCMPAMRVDLKMEKFLILQLILKMLLALILALDKLSRVGILV
jgi:hypothetical protein